MATGQGSGPLDFDGLLVPDVFRGQEDAPSELLLFAAAQASARRLPAIDA